VELKSRDDMPSHSTLQKLILLEVTLQWYESFIAGNGRFAVKDYLLLLR
jgi:hypothetical protein